MVYQRRQQWIHAVCVERVGVNSIHCERCGYWVHGRYSGVQGSLVGVAQGKAEVFQRLRATERRMLRMICRVILKDKVESTVIALRVGVDNLEEHLRQKRLRWFRHIVRRDE